MAPKKDKSALGVKYSKPKAKPEAKPKANRYESMDRKVGSCKQWTLQVSNQKTSDHCCFFAYADCLTTYFKMKGLLDDKLFLSAQCLVDWGKTKWEDIARLCCGKLFGLMTTEDYPYEAVPRPPYASWKDYHRAQVLRYRVRGFKAFATPEGIKRELVKYFCEGPGHACIGSLFVGELRKRKASDILPYHHPPNFKPVRGTYHTVVIVGVSISGNKSDHFVEIKSSWGKKWAQEGFTKIGFDVLDQIEILVEHQDPQIEPSI